MLSLPHAEFDQNMEGGWRPLASQPECREVAADLIAAYRRANWAQLRSSDLHLNYWHEGQLRAALGQTERAVPLLMAGVNPANTGDGFDEYALGTIAFLLNDRAGLQAARDRLAVVPKPEGFDRAAADFRAKYGFDAEWPQNLGVLDQLLACFGKSYDEAYGECEAS